MITNSVISYGDQLGAQMSTFAELVFLAKENRQDICFFKELKNFRRRYRILENFDLPAHLQSGEKLRFLRRLFLPIPELYCLQFKLKGRSVANHKRIYFSRIRNFIDKCFFHGCRLFYRDFIVFQGKNGVHCDTSLLNLDSTKNYDIQSGFGTFQDWKKCQEEILNLFKFKEKIQKEAAAIYESIKGDKPTVSVHFRKGDYLILSSLNLTIDYYKKALKNFDKDKYKLLVFSDDIESCKDTGLFDGYEVCYMDAHPAGVDMRLMSLCDNNIIANSSFSFWGAFLNKNKEKIVVCPRDYVGQSSPDYLYMNGNWYPESWIAL